MESEAVSKRPESPKKKVKSNPSSDSEAQPSNYSKSAHRTDGHGQNSVHINGLAPIRGSRLYASAADSSSERGHIECRDNRPPLRVQEEEVSSSENSVGRAKETRGSPAEGVADSLSKESDDFNLICDSASADTNDKH